MGTSGRCLGSGIIGNTELVAEPAGNPQAIVDPQDCRYLSGCFAGTGSFDRLCAAGGLFRNHWRGNRLGLQCLFGPAAARNGADGHLHGGRIIPVDRHVCTGPGDPGRDAGVVQLGR